MKEKDKIRGFNADHIVVDRSIGLSDEEYADIIAEIKTKPVKTIIEFCDSVPPIVMTWVRWWFQHLDHTESNCDCGEAP